MKTAVIFCTVLALLQAHFQLVCSKPLEESDYWGEDKEICVRELKLNREKIKALDQQEIAAEDDPNFNIFAQCFFIRSGIQDLNGAIKYGKIKQLFEAKIDQSFDYINTEKTRLLKSIAFDAVDVCEAKLPRVSDNPGQLAVRVGNCIMGYLSNIDRKQMASSSYGVSSSVI